MLEDCAMRQFDPLTGDALAFIQVTRVGKNLTLNSVGFD